MIRLLSALMLFCALVLLGCSRSTIQAGYPVAGLDPQAIVALDSKPDSWVVVPQPPEAAQWEKGPGNEVWVGLGSRTFPGHFGMWVHWFEPEGNDIPNTSQPHAHPKDRFIRVVRRPCWMGTGEKYDPKNMVPFPKGAYLWHKAGQPHYDGAKKGSDCLMLVQGEGPIGSPPQTGPPK